MNYYNEHDPKAASWLRELIAGGLIPAGDVDTRSIKNVSPDDLSNYTQCHFFAGIGGWSYALQLAGWPPSRRAWTGSCPCQPFSQAGKQMGRRDPRHLWPAFRRLINRCRPPIVFGEQVASADGRLWLAGVSANLETMGYATAAADLCAASVGAPHPRQRLYWMANDASERWDGAAGVQGTHGRPIAETSSTLERMGIANGAGRDTRQPATASARYGNPTESDGRACEMGNAHEQGREGQPLGQLGASDQSHWTDYDILHCIDGKSRRIEPGTFPLADGVPGRVGLLRGYGNAIVPQVAAEFVKACSEILPLNAIAVAPPTQDSNEGNYFMIPENTDTPQKADCNPRLVRLLPCPFCGSEARIGQGHGWPGETVIECSNNENCRARMSCIWGEKNETVLWNARANPQPNANCPPTGGNKA